uniref:GGDEF domain-containing protein n=1 Tax=Dialister succinatiphilus TaxID=487173 RepID=UPI004038EBED
MAYHDALTGLYNHAGIFHIAKSLDSRKSYALLFMDLNGLKEVNDRYGHEAGDFFLCHMAKILSSVTPSSAFCGRLGGDEFIILLPPHEADSLFPLIKTIRKKMQELKGLPHMPKDPSASFGWSIHEPSQPLSFDDHLNEADDRMYEEKEKYKLTHPAEAGRNFRREK